MHVSVWSRRPLPRLVPLEVRVSAALIEEYAASCRSPSDCVLYHAMRRLLPGAGRLQVFHRHVLIGRDRPRSQTFRIALPEEATLFQRRLGVRDLAFSGGVVPVEDRWLLVGLPQPFTFGVYAPAWALPAPALAVAS